MKILGCAMAMTLLATATTASRGAGAGAGEPDPLRAELAARRAQAMDALHAYWVAGEFPVNVYTDRTVNIFRDGAGRLCAVANLIHQSGRDDLVDAQVAADDFIALRDLKGGAIADWIVGSGLTREEIVDLQGEGYSYVRHAPRPLLPDLGDYRIALERGELRTRLSAAEVRLRADTARSLDVAVGRAHAARLVRATTSRTPAVVSANPAR